jgi:DinB superfamily
MANDDEAEREAALAAFDRAHAAFAAALAETPAAALRYRPAGEDYALGGLAVHVAQVLDKYARVLEAMRAADFGPVDEPPPAAASEAEAALVRDGFDAEQRPLMLERVRAAHAGVVAGVRAVPAGAFRRAAAVRYVGASEPYATSAADVLGWVGDHYGEHTEQIGQLQAAWARAM